MLPTVDFARFNQPTRAQISPLLQRYLQRESPGVDAKRLTADSLDFCAPLFKNGARLITATLKGELIGFAIIVPIRGNEQGFRQLVQAGVAETAMEIIALVCAGSDPAGLQSTLLQKIRDASLEINAPGIVMLAPKNARHRSAIVAAAFEKVAVLGRADVGYRDLLGFKLGGELIVSASGRAQAPTPGFTPGVTPPPQGHDGGGYYDAHGNFHGPARESHGSIH